MTRIPPYQALIRPAVLSLALAVVGCSTLSQSGTSSAASSAELNQGLELYRSGDLQGAEPIFTAIYNTTTAAITDQRRALAAAVLIRLERSTNTSLDEAEMLLERYAQLDSGPIDPEYYLLRESLSKALAASRETKSQQGALIAASRKLEASQFERRQLEETLKKLRKLSLE